MKDFEGWNSEKQRVNELGPKLYHERELWWCSLGVNVGSEQDGTGKDFRRPILILRGISRETCFGVPLSTSVKRHQYRVPIGHVEGRDAVAIISQMRLIDTRRLVNKIGYLDREVFLEVKKAAKDLL